jgi:hypothetical protein
MSKPTKDDTPKRIQKSHFRVCVKHLSVSKFDRNLGDGSAEQNHTSQYPHVLNFTAFPFTPALHRHQTHTRSRYSTANRLCLKWLNVPSYGDPWLQNNFENLIQPYSGCKLIMAGS